MDDSFKAQLLALLPRLRRYARAKVGLTDRADDLVQSTLERAWKARASCIAGVPIDSWVFRILHNLHVDDLRALATRGINVGAGPLEHLQDQRWTHQVESSITLTQVTAVMRELPEPMREVLALVPVEGFSYAEAADILGVPVGTVMSRLARARVELMKRLNMPNKAVNEGVLQ